VHSSICISNFYICDLIFNSLLTPMAFDVASKMLTYRPSARISATAALHSPYFISEEPPACTPSELPMPEGDWHEFESKQRKKRQKAAGTIEQRRPSGEGVDRRKRAKPTATHSSSSPK
jgi:hypothetical protein